MQFELYWKLYFSFSEIFVSIIFTSQQLPVLKMRFNLPPIMWGFDIFFMAQVILCRQHSHIGCSSCSLTHYNKHNRMITRMVRVFLQCALNKLQNVRPSQNELGFNFKSKVKSLNFSSRTRRKLLFQSYMFLFTLFIAYTLKNVS